MHRLKTDIRNIASSVDVINTDKNILWPIPGQPPYKGENPYEDIIGGNFRQGNGKEELKKIKYRHGTGR
jgi:hypothetical protein